MSEAIEERIRQHLISEFGLPASLAVTDSLLKRGLLVSAQMIDIVLFVEDEFGVVLRPVDVAPENLESVASMAKVVRERLIAEKK